MGVQYAISPSTTNSRAFVRVCPEFMHQWALSIKTFFSAIINSSSDDPLEQSFHAHIFFRWYFHDFVEQIYSNADDNLDSEALAVIVSVITEISVALHDSPDSKRHFLFYTTSYYAKLLSTGNFRPKHPSMIVLAVSRLAEALGNYKAHLGPGGPFLGENTGNTQFLG